MKTIGKLKKFNGFTLVETLLTTLILLMVTAVVAAGMPVAVNAYRNVIEVANSHILLSTTVNRLNEELSTALWYRIVVIDDNTKLLYYSHGDDYISCIPASASGNEGIIIKHLKYDGSTQLLDKDGAKIDPHSLVSSETETVNLHAEYDSITYDDDVFTITNLRSYRVKQESSTDKTVIGKIDELKIRPIIIPELLPIVSTT